MLAKKLAMSCQIIKNEGENMSSFSNSPLVVYTKLSPNHYGARKHAIDTISIHCVVGHLSLQKLGDIFAPSSRQASSNYGVDDEGRVGMYVEEKNASWCTSSESNDRRAITIEVASDTFAPYKVTDKALQGLIELCADVCKRNNIVRLKWLGDKSFIGQVDKQNMTVHRWFKNKACPGDYLYNKHGFIADEVNKKIKTLSIPTIGRPNSTTFTPYIVSISVATLNYRKGPGINYAVAGHVRKNEVYTIVEEAQGPGASNWGKLKSGAGWISLDHVNRK